ncbi:MAG TPA: tetratricopeptide repeat-containing protein [Longimicrobium sp.]
MPADSAHAETGGTCFVIMGFGKKTDFETGRTLDLDKSYRNIIKPAAEAAGLTCIRADEIVHSGVIDVPMYEQLLNADVVVADLSTSNRNALYELGIRHALRPYTTVVVAEDGNKTFPFDLSHLVFRQYRHLGEDIGYEEVMRFREELTIAIRKIMAENPRAPDSPVYTFLRGLQPPAVATAGGVAPETDVRADATHSSLMQQVDEAQAQGDFETAKTLLSTVRRMRREALRAALAPEGAAVAGAEPPEDAYILQRLALVTYKSKSKKPDEKTALLEAQGLLRLLDPETSNDPETLGLWQAVHKRLWTLTGERRHLDEAIRAVERGFYLRNDYYNGINLAFLLNQRAVAQPDPAEAIADFVQARRVRREVLAICDRWIETNPGPTGKDATPKAVKQYEAGRYWVLATRAEAVLGLDGEEQAQPLLEEAFARAPEDWMRKSTEEQVGALRKVLADSPLRYLRSGPAGT